MALNQQVGHEEEIIVRLVDKQVVYIAFGFKPVFRSSGTIILRSFIKETPKK